MLFEIDNLTKVYQGRTVIDIQNLVFEKGMIYALLGPNGSGKTTLLEILSLIIPPTTGRIKYNHRYIRTAGNHLTEVRREIVMVPQNPILFTTSVRKNVEFGLKVRDVSHQKRGKIIDEALDLVGMGEFKYADAHKLSGGETQRVAIARALACAPKVMFFDEPTSNVDVENRARIEKIMRNINVQKNISVIFTTHNLTQASKLAHKVISLFEGRTVSSVFENIFRGKMGMEGNGVRSCVIQDRVSIKMRTKKKDQVKLSIDPHKIKLYKGPQSPSAPNVYSGRLTQVSDQHPYIRAVVDIGIPLNILLRQKEFRNIKINVGDDVFVTCPEESIRVF